MKIPMLIKPRFRLLPFALPLLLLACPFVLAQDQAENEEDEEVFELSPFVVNTDGDVGYLAGNTLSGSRMNAKLKDTAASISVFTPEFLEDLGATSTSETIRYGTNSNPDYQQGSSSPTLAFLDAGLYSDTRINIRGILASRTIDFFETAVPSDYYNLSRSDLSSGPNSILFGFANAGGIFNSSTKDAEFRRDLTTIQLQVGSWDWLRTTLDSNIIAIEDKLAVRLMGVWMESGGWRTWEFKDTQRGTIAVQFKPTKTIRIRASYEKAKMQNDAQKPFGYYDRYSGYFTGTKFGQPVDNRGITVWTDNEAEGWGSGPGPVPLYLPGAGTFIYNDFRNNGATYTQSQPVWKGYGFDTNGEPVPDWRWDEIGSVFNKTIMPHTADNLFNFPHIPLEYGTGGPDASRDTEFDRFLIRAEKSLGENTVFELAFNYENSWGKAWVPSSDLFYDVAGFIPDPNDPTQAIPNPDYGRFYSDTTWWGNEESVDSKVLRGTLSHDLDLDKFGYHRLAGFFEFSEIDSRTYGGPLNYFDENGFGLTPQSRQDTFPPPDDPADYIPSPNPAHWTNFVRVREYFDYDDPSTFHAGSRPTEFPLLLNPFPETGNQTSYTARFVGWGAPGENNTNVRRNVREINSFMIADQSYFLKDKLVLTLGYRYDDITFDEYDIGRALFGSPEVEDGTYVVNQRIFTDDVEYSYDFESKTFTAGLVYHLTPQVSIFYNEASNSGPSQLNRILLPSSFEEDGTPKNTGEIPPLSDGSGRDVGFMFDLMDGKVFARLSYYETRQEKETAIRAGRVSSINNALVENLRFPEDTSGNLILPGGQNPNIITQEEYEARYLRSQGDVLSDTSSKGYELEVKLNLMKGWSTTLSYSYTDLERTNIFPRFEPWFESTEAFFSRFYDGFYIGDVLYFMDENGVLTTDPQANDLEKRVNDMVLSAENMRNVESFGFNNRPHKFNIFTRYEIQEGPLEKLFFGGGVRWQSKNKIQRELIGIDDQGIDILGDRVLEGNEIFQTDLFVGYVIDHINFLGIQGGWMRIQLNVYNVFDNQDLNIIRFSRAEDPDARDLYWKVATQTPRQYRLTLSLSF